MVTVLLPTVYLHQHVFLSVTQASGITVQNVKPFITHEYLRQAFFGRACRFSIWQKSLNTYTHLGLEDAVD